MMELKKLSGLLVAVLGLFTACRKGVATVDSSGITSTVENNKIKDTVLKYSRDLYLWYKQIPDTFQAKNYADPDAMMTALRQFSLESGFSQPVDRWSFAMKQQEWDNVSSGISGDFGLGVFFRGDSDLRVKSVEKASPAGIAGIKRGWRITKINGSTSLTSANADFIVNNIYYSKTSSFTFQKPDSSLVDISLNAATYQEHPVYLDTVYQIGGKNIGYMVFNSFLGDTTEIYSQFQRIFNRFSQASVGDVIIDLRYNGGGYLTVQSKLANYLINASGNGNLMMKQEYNDKFSEENSSENFKKQGLVNLNRIYFIVSNNTASASELLINSLKPYMDEKLIGPSNTYGKPVGFFPVPVGDWYIFPVSFRSTNKNGEGNYFNGLTLSNQVADGLDKDWGDVSESCLASALKNFVSGSFRTMTGNEIQQQSEVKEANTKLSAPAFKGTVGSRRAF